MPNSKRISFKMEEDWQSRLYCLSERGAALLESGRWADCHFVLGNASNQLIFACHKLILSAASPVFEAMFYGELAEKNDPIPILDVQPEAFRALLQYIYTDVINVDTIDKACELCYAAKKYMLPHVVQTCTNFLFKDLCPKNACRAYEFAKLFEEPRLMKNCLDLMCSQTMNVLEDPTFEEADVRTIMTIFEQEVLNIDSELSLLLALKRYAERHCPDTQDDSSAGDGPSEEPSAETQDDQRERMHIREALKRIRFLTLTPQEFAENSISLMTQAESYAIIMNISSRNASVPMPEGFSSNRNTRLLNSMQLRAVTPLDMDSMGPLDLVDGSGAASMSHGFVNSLHGAPMSTMRLADMSSSAGPSAPAPAEERFHTHGRRYYCIRSVGQQTDCLNTSVLDCSLTFTVDRSICITGVQVPTQVLGEPNMQRCNTDGNFPERYSELLYAHLLDSVGARLTYTHCTARVRFDSTLEISFDRPVYIQKNKMYKIGVVFNKVGWYPMCVSVPHMTCTDVFFKFGVGSLNESVRDGLIRAIVFTFPRESS